jgi:tryptophan synthase alpha chain
MGMVQVLDHVREFRKRNNTTPVVLMGYANPVERYDQIHGQGAFVRDAAEAGVDGVLIVDYPPEECEAFAAKLRAHGMDLIFLLAPTTTERMAAGGARGQRLCVLRLAQGRDGFGRARHCGVEAMLPRIREHVHIPVGVGFGIRDAATAQAIGRVADAVVIGSRIIQLIEDQEHANGSSRDHGFPARRAQGARRII